MRPLRTSAWLTAAIGAALGAGAIVAVPAPRLFVPAARQADGATGERWACPMMDYIGDHPGPCPVCGMALEHVTAGELTHQQQKRMGIQLTTVASGTAQVTIRAYGAVRFDERTAQAVIPRVSGRIVARYPGALHHGLVVAAGEPLIELYSPQVFAAGSELAAAVKLGEAATVQALSDRFARWNLSAVAAAIRSGQAPADTVTITSPASGLVLGSDMTGSGAEVMVVGAEVMADAPLLTLVDPQAFELVVHVPEPQAHWVKPGQPVAIASDDRGELPDLGATVTWIAPGLDPEIRARAVHLHLRDAHGRLLVGSLVNARFQVALGPDLEPADPTDRSTWGSFVLVPKSAVLSTGVRNVAWRATTTDGDGRHRFEIASLALGPRIEDVDGEDRYVVRSGLAAGDRIATQGLFLIDSQAQLAGSASLLFPAGAASAAPAHPH